MSRAGYTRFACRVCSKQISTSGGSVNHYRKHVREGLMTKERQGAFPNFYDSYIVTDKGVQFVRDRKEKDSD